MDFDSDADKAREKPFRRSNKNLSVSISPKRTAPSSSDEPESGVEASDVTIGATDDLSALMALVGDDQQATPSKPSRPLRLLVINGPNINMLGIREPDIYGKESFPELLRLCRSAAAEAGFVKCVCYQSNHEGDIVDQIQDAHGFFDAIVINPGAYTHTSIAILDALKATSIPTIEVHISDVSKREDFRSFSYVKMACIDTVMGEGIQGYRTAIFRLADYLRSQEA